MVDVVACTVFGARSGSLDNWARGARDPLSVAMYDFPKRGIMVRPPARPRVEFDETNERVGGWV